MCQPLGGFLLLRRRMMQIAMRITIAAAIKTTMMTTAIIAVELVGAVITHAIWFSLYCNYYFRFRSNSFISCV